MNKLYDFGIVIIVAVLLVTVVGTVAHKFSKDVHPSGNEAYSGHDTPVEEFCEDVYEFLTQDDIDFTPESPEE